MEKGVSSYVNPLKTIKHTCPCHKIRWKFSNSCTCTLQNDVTLNSNFVKLDFFCHTFAVFPVELVLKDES